MGLYHYSMALVWLILLGIGFIFRDMQLAMIGAVLYGLFTIAGEIDNLKST